MKITDVENRLQEILDGGKENIPEWMLAISSSEASSCLFCTVLVSEHMATNSIEKACSSIAQKLRSSMGIEALPVDIAAMSLIAAKRWEKDDIVDAIRLVIMAEEKLNEADSERN